MAGLSRLESVSGAPEQTPPIGVEVALPVGLGRLWFAARASVGKGSAL